MRMDVYDARKIAVVGIPGSGKTRLTKELAGVLNLSPFYMDVHFLRNFKGLDMKEKISLVSKGIEEETSKESWIIDGNYPSHGEALKLRMERADVVLYLNLPVDVCVENIQKRGYLDVEAMNALDSEESLEELIFQVQNYEEKNGKVKHALQTYASDKYVELNSKEDVDNFIEQLKKQKNG